MQMFILILQVSFYNDFFTQPSAVLTCHVSVAYGLVDRPAARSTVGTMPYVSSKPGCKLDVGLHRPMSSFQAGIYRLRVDVTVD